VRGEEWQGKYHQKNRKSSRRDARCCSGDPASAGSPNGGVKPPLHQTDPLPDVPGLTSFAVGPLSLNSVTSGTALPSYEALTRKAPTAAGWKASLALHPRPRRLWPPRPSGVVWAPGCNPARAVVFSPSMDRKNKLYFGDNLDILRRPLGRCPDEAAAQQRAGAVGTDEG